MNTDNKIKISVVDHKTIYDITKSTDVVKESYPFKYLQNYIIVTDSLDESDYIYANLCKFGEFCREFNILKNQEYYIKYKKKFIFYTLDDAPFCAVDEEYGTKLFSMPRDQWIENIKNNIIMTPLIDEEILYSGSIDNLVDAEKKYEYGFIGGIWSDSFIPRDFLYNFEKREDSLIINTRYNKSIFKIGKFKKWKIQRHQTGYYDNLCKVKFGFCPTGGGLNSYRLGECMRIGVIPIIVGHKSYPFEDEINWSEFSLIFENQNEITHENIQSMMKSKNYDHMKEMCMKIWKKFFEPQSQANYIYNKYLNKT